MQAFAFMADYIAHAWTGRALKGKLWASNHQSSSENLIMHQYEVIVGNVGAVWSGANGFRARQEYGVCCEWVRDSAHRAAGEPVTLMRDGEPLHEYDPDAGFYFVEVTDTFGGEANYCWVRRYKVRASTVRGAIGKVPGYSWRKDWSDGEMTRYVARGAAVCAFVEQYERDKHSEFATVEEI